jgi:hypothetical protein
MTLLLKEPTKVAMPLVEHKLFLPGDPRLKNQTVRQDLYTRRIDINYFMTVAGGLGAKMTQMGAPTPAD